MCVIMEGFVDAGKLCRQGLAAQPSIEFLRPRGLMTDHDIYSKESLSEVNYDYRPSLASTVEV